MTRHSLFVAGALALLTKTLVSAMSPDIGTECETCRFPTAVQFGLCSGVHVGNGVIITAGHCVNTVIPGTTKVNFGEDSQNEAFDVTIDYCEIHPDGEPDTTVWGEPSWNGPDIAYCILQDDAPDFFETIPVIPPMLPEGCERDWLAEQVYDTPGPTFVTAVGQGCAIFPEYSGHDCQPGIKRFSSQDLVHQTTRAGTSTKLELERDYWGDTDTGIRSGDSGGPVFIKMPLPDNTWRLIGVMSMTAISAYAEAVPPYLRWIEVASGRDITPNHYYHNGKWKVSNPTAWLPKYEHEPASWGSWVGAHSYLFCSSAPRGYSDSYTEVRFIGCAYKKDPDDFAVERGSELEGKEDQHTDTFFAEPTDEDFWVAHSFLPITDAFSRSGEEHLKIITPNDTPNTMPQDLTFGGH